MQVKTGLCSKWKLEITKFSPYWGFFFSFFLVENRLMVGLWNKKSNYFMMSLKINKYKKKAPSQSSLFVFKQAVFYTAHLSICIYISPYAQPQEKKTWVLELKRCKEVVRRRSSSGRWFKSPATHTLPVGTHLYYINCSWFYNHTLFTLWFYT